MPLGEAVGDCIPDPRTCVVLGAAQYDVPMRRVRISSLVFPMFPTGFQRCNGALRYETFFIVHSHGLALQGFTRHAEPFVQETLEYSH